MSRLGIKHASYEYEGTTWISFREEERSYYPLQYRHFVNENVHQTCSWLILMMTISENYMLEQRFVCMQKEKICTGVSLSPDLYPIRVLDVNKELFTLQKKPWCCPILRFLCNVLYISVFPFLSIALSVLRFTVSDYHFGFFKLYVTIHRNEINSLNFPLSSE